MAFNDFYRQLRLMDGRSDEPSLLTIDSQSVKTAKMSNLSKGFDGGKKVKGRKRHLAVDGAGNIVGVVVTSANTHDVKGGKKLIRKLKKKHEVSAVQKVVADKGYRGEKLSKYVKKFLGGEVEIGENHTNPNTNSCLLKPMCPLS
ncbi:DDE family transposase [Gluconacetobacter diazotrophicus]|nr:DDE family transposase [Gluconacetobacter diazotrophicus]